MIARAVLDYPLVADPVNFFYISVRTPIVCEKIKS